MNIEMLTSMAAIDATAWDRLTDGNPFQSHTFLKILEDTGCVGGETGWHPTYLCVYEDEILVACTAAYLKTHSMGEFVYDFQFARYAESNGIAYYPKIVVASPYSPVTGQRLHAPTDRLRTVLVESLVALAVKLRAHSVNVLFPREGEEGAAVAAGYYRRDAFQYQWHQNGYATFDDFLLSMRSKRRKEIRRERRIVADAGFDVRAIEGESITDAWIEKIYGYYAATCNQYSWGRVYLSRAFFEQLIRKMPESVIFFGAFEGEEMRGGAFCLRTKDTLYGRYWGAECDVPFLHFEACLYAPIAWAIANGVQTIEPGAGGEHKFARGFVPTPTYSLHKNLDPQFHRALAHFCDNEADAIRNHIHVLNEKETPFQRREH